MWRLRLAQAADFGRTALHDVRDVNVFAPQAHGLDHLRQQFAGISTTADPAYLIVAAGLRR